MINIKEIVDEYLLKEIDNTINTFIVRCADDKSLMERLHLILSTHIDSVDFFMMEENQNNE